MTIPAKDGATVQPDEQSPTEGSAMLPELGQTTSTLGLDKARDPRQAVFTALGAATACWENLQGAGVFESTRAKEIGDELMEYLYAHGLPRG